MNAIRRFYTILCLLIIVALSSNAQTIRIVNNNLNRPTGANMYTSLQAAIDAATAGDIIQVVGSATSYGSINVTKQLSIYGIGLNPTKDQPLRSMVDGITLQNTSTSNSSGTLISGFSTGSSGSNVSIGYVPSGVATALSNITLEKCNLQTGFGLVPNNVNISNIVVRNCQIINGNVNLITVNGDPTLCSNIIITNCYINNSNGFIGNLSNAIINHCVIGNNTSSSVLEWGGNWIRNCIFSNNIFYGIHFYGQTIELCTFSNNINFPLETASDTLIPAGSGIGNSGIGNMNNVDPQFAGTGFFIPMSGSPAKNAGTDGTDIGLYGGTTPFDYAGMPLPHIQSFNTSAVVQKGGNLQVQVKAVGVK